MDQAYGAMAPARITRCVTSGARGARGVTASRRRSSERSTGGAISPASAARRDTGAPDAARTIPVRARLPSTCQNFVFKKLDRRDGLGEFRLLRFSPKLVHFVRIDSPRSLSE